MANPMAGLAQYLTSVGPDYGTPGMVGGQEMKGGQPMLPKPMISSPLHGPYAPGMQQNDNGGVQGGKPTMMGDSPPHPMAQLGRYLAVNGINARHYMRGRSA